MEQQTQDSALLVLDMQVGTLAMLPGASEILSNVAKAIASARVKNIPVIYAVLGFRKGAPEISKNNKSFSALKLRLAEMDMAAFMKLPDEIAPHDGEVVMAKRRVSAFTGNDMEVVLRSAGIRHLVLTGISTSGVILSTMREAVDKDYRITILSDCCADGDEEVHRVLTTKIFPRHAEVLTLTEWI